MLLVDEAHATGVIGATGRGAGELLECEHQIDVRVGTLSKALGCFGGFVAGRRDLIDWIFNRARTYLFSTAQPEILAAAARTAIQLVIDEPQRRNHLLQLSDHLRARLIDHKFDIGNSQSHIVPIIVGQSEAALAISDQLMNDGFFVPAIRPPSVPADAARLRISLCSSHQSEHVDKLVDSLVRIRR
jgi:8-amino-7-oxononanoate synthase